MSKLNNFVGTLKCEKWMLNYGPYPVKRFMKWTVIITPNTCYVNVNIMYLLIKSLNAL